MASEEKPTYCRICEPLCGMVATVDDGRLTKLRPDPEHPLSAGFACPKGIAMAEVQNDPDRVLHPQRRRADGSFERVTWPEALDEIGERLRRVIDARGGDSVGWYMGNPGAFSYSHPLWVKGFLDAIGSPHSYTASSQDVSNRFAASSFLYGSPFLVPIPDLARTDFLFMVGANPLVSHGSVLSAPRIKDQLHAITARGGRVVVVDPRRSETASAFEHLAIEPDSDAWLLLSILEVIFAGQLEDGAAIERQSVGIDALRELCAAHPPESTEGRTTAATRQNGGRPSRGFAPGGVKVPDATASAVVIVTFAI
jgi:formate dehydrogenase